MYDNQILPPSYSSATFNNANQSTMFNSSSYAMQGTAYNPNGINYFEQAMQQRELLMQQQREYQTKLLQENYPEKYVLVHSFILGGLSISAIVLQILIIVGNSKIYTIGAGIWVGVFFLVATTLALVVLKKRNYCLYTITVIMHFMGFMISIGGLVMTNVFNFGPSTSTYTYALVGIGAVCAIISIAFAISMQCFMKKKNNTTQIGAFQNNGNNMNVVNNTNPMIY